MLAAAAGQQLRRQSTPTTRRRATRSSSSPASCRRRSSTKITQSIVNAPVIGRPFVILFTLCCQTVVLSVISCVRSVYCGQTVECIRIPLGTEVGLGPGHTVLDGEPAPPTERATAAPPPLFDPLCSGRVAHLSNCWVLVPYRPTDRLIALCRVRRWCCVEPLKIWHGYRG